METGASIPIALLLNVASAIGVKVNIPIGAKNVAESKTGVLQVGQVLKVPGYCTDVCPPVMLPMLRVPKLIPDVIGTCALSRPPWPG